MIILNEKEYAIECLKNKELGDKPLFTISILAKYYYHCLNYRKKKITDLLIDFMSKYYQRYECNKADWNNSIEKIAANAGKYPLHEIDGVWITKTELETITNIHNDTLERLAFSLLCLAKYANIKNAKNNNWVNLDYKEVFKMARISCNATDRYRYINKLYQRSLLGFASKNDNLSCRLTFVDNGSDNAIFISDFRELGYEYMHYLGEPFIRCRECGILMRGSKNGSKKYCPNCAAYSPIKTKTITCVDCGFDFVVDARVSNKVRCDACQELRNKIKKRDWKRANGEKIRDMGV